MKRINKIFQSILLILFAPAMLHAAQVPDMDIKVFNTLTTYAYDSVYQQLNQNEAVHQFNNLKHSAFVKLLVLADLGYMETNEKARKKQEKNPDITNLLEAKEIEFKGYQKGFFANLDKETYLTWQTYQTHISPQQPSYNSSLSPLWGNKYSLINNTNQTATPVLAVNIIKTWQAYITSVTNQESQNTDGKISDAANVINLITGDSVDDFYDALKSKGKLPSPQNNNEQLLFINTSEPDNKDDNLVAEKNSKHNLNKKQPSPKQNSNGTINQNRKNKQDKNNPLVKSQENKNKNESVQQGQLPSLVSTINPQSKHKKKHNISFPSGQNNNNSSATNVHTNEQKHHPQMHQPMQSANTLIQDISYSALQTGTKTNKKSKDKKLKANTNNAHTKHKNNNPRSHQSAHKTSELTNEQKNPSPSLLGTDHNSSVPANPQGNNQQLQQQQLQNENVAPHDSALQDAAKQINLRDAGQFNQLRPTEVNVSSMRNNNQTNKLLKGSVKVFLGVAAVGGIIWGGTKLLQYIMYNTSAPAPAQSATTVPMQQVPVTVAPSAALSQMESMLNAPLDFLQEEQLGATLMTHIGNKAGSIAKTLFRSITTNWPTAKMQEPNLVVNTIPALQQHTMPNAAQEKGLLGKFTEACLNHPKVAVGSTIAGMLALWYRAWPEPKEIRKLGENAAISNFFTKPIQDATQGLLQNILPKMIPGISQENITLPSFFTHPILGPGINFIFGFFGRKIGEKTGLEFLLATQVMEPLLNQLALLFGKVSIPTAVAGLITGVATLIGLGTKKALSKELAGITCSLLGMWLGWVVIILINSYIKHRQKAQACLREIEATLQQQQQIALMRKQQHEEALQHNFLYWLITRLPLPMQQKLCNGLAKLENLMEKNKGVSAA